MTGVRGAPNDGGGLEFSLLGPLRVSRDGVPVDLGGRQQRVVLALLLVNARTAVSVDRIADVLWGDARGTRHAATLQTYIFHLRAALEPGRNPGSRAMVLTTADGGGYLLDVADNTLDTNRFERLVEDGRTQVDHKEFAAALALLDAALSMWRGPVLADLAEFGFATPFASRLEDIRLSAEEARIDADLELGRHVAAVIDLDRLIDDYPLRERLHEQRMLGLYRSGRQSEALAAFHQLRKTLNEEMGVNPSAPLQRLHQAILAQDPGLDRDPTPNAVVRGDPGPPSLVDRVELSLLGQFRLVIGEHDESSRCSPRGITLLSYLALHHGRAQRREHLAGLFWPDSTAAQARTNLRRELHQLKVQVPGWDALVAIDGQTVTCLDTDGVQLDVAVFEGAARAAAAAWSAGQIPAFRQAFDEAADAYGGELVPGCYDEWLPPARDRLRRTLVSLIDQRVELDRETGDFKKAVELARRRIELEPLEESGYLTLLELHTLQGDRAAGLQTYHRCVSTLERELGVAPGQATTDAYQRLLGGEAPATPQQAPRAPAGAHVLVGRDAELEVFHSCWQEACQGLAGFVVVTGEAGVGKTRLLDEVVNTAQRAGAVTARARCYAAKGRMPLAPVSAWLRSPALAAGRGRLEAAWAHEVDRLIPTPGSDPTVAESRLTEPWQRHRFFEGLVRAALATNRPTLLVLDDLQWCDDDTLAWLDVLLGLGSSRPLLVVAATRLEELDDNPHVAEFLRILRTRQTSTEMPLSPLTVTQSCALAATIVGRSAHIDADQLQRTTGGFPLFVVEAARAQSLEGGALVDARQLPRVQAVLAGRIEQASAEAREVAGLAAAFGRDFSVDELVDATSLTTEACVAAIDELWRRRLIRENSATTYDFSHDLFRDAAYEAVTPPRRPILHLRVAQALERTHADNLASVAAAIADQYEHAGQAQPAVPHHLRAAESAVGVFANQQAIWHFLRAVQLLQAAPPGAGRDAAELRIQLTMSAPLNWQYGFASTELETALERALELAEHLGDTRQRVSSMAGLQGLRTVQGNLGEAVDLGQRCLELARNHLDLRGQAHFGLAVGLFSLPRYRRALQHLTAAEKVGRSTPPLLVGTHIHVFAPAVAAHANLLLGRDGDAVACSERAIAFAEELDRPHDLAVALAYAAITQQIRGDRSRMSECVRRVNEICDRYHFAYYREWAVIIGGWQTGGAAGAKQIRGSLDRLHEQRALFRHPYYLSLLAETLLDAGQPEEAGAVLATARADAEARDERWWEPELWRLDARRFPGLEGDRMLASAHELANVQESPLLRERAAQDLRLRGYDPNALRTVDFVPSKP